MSFFQIFQWRRGDTCERPYSLTGDVEARYYFALPFVRGKSVLDIGSGFGLGSHYLALNGAKKVLGIDISSPAIKESKKRFSLLNLDFKVMDGTQMSLPKKSFEAVIAFEVIEHLPLEKHHFLLRGIREILKKGGVFLISTPNKLFTSPGSDKPRNPYHLKEFEPEELISFLKQYFSRVSLRGLRCGNREYIKQREKLFDSLRYRLSAWAVRYKFLSDFSTIIPRQIKLKISCQNKLISLGREDFIIDENIRQAENLIGICRL